MEDVGPLQDWELVCEDEKEWSNVGCVTDRVHDFARQKMCA